MRRRRIWLTLLILATALVVVLGGLAVFLKQVPDFYTGPEAQAKSDDDIVASSVITRYGDFQSALISTDPEWSANFTAAELNAFFREHVDDGQQFAYQMPEYCHDPRIAVEGDRVKIGCRIGEGLYSAIFSVECQVWLVDKEVNTVAVKLCDLRIGAVPGESQWFLDWITEVGRRNNTDVTWYRHEGRPVGIFRFYANQPRPTNQIHTVMVGDGRMVVRGRKTLDIRGP